MFQGLEFLFLYSIVHVFLPGHLTPILLPLSSTIERKNFILFGCSMGLGQALETMLAIWIGVYLGDKLTFPASLNILIQNVDIVIIACVGGYLYGASKTKKESTKDEAKKRDYGYIKSISYGFISGVIPSPDSIGFLMLGASLSKTNIDFMSPVLIGGIGSFIGVALATLISVNAIKLANKINSPKEKVLKITAIMCAIYCISRWLYSLSA